MRWRSWPTNNPISNAEAATPRDANLHVFYRVYDDEQTTAKAAQLLVEAGFPPRDVYVGVERGKGS